MFLNNSIKGFSKLTKEEKLKLVADHFQDSALALEELKDFWHSDNQKQKLFDEFSENTISNFYFPFGVAPNMTINGKNYMIPMVIEESSVIAAASSSAKFWAERGGFKAEIISTEKIGQFYFFISVAYMKHFLFTIFFFDDRILIRTRAVNGKLICRQS